MGILILRSSVAQGGGGGGGDTLTHGQDFTVTGTGYGTRGDYGGAADRLNWAWLDFEAALEDDGWNLNGGVEAEPFWEWMTTGNRTARSTRWAKRFSNGAPSNTQYLRTSSGFSTGKFFFSVWHYNQTDANGKTIRIWYNNGTDDFWVNYGEGAAASDAPNQYVDFGVGIAANTWTRVDYYLRNGGANGLLIDMWNVGQNSNNPIYTKDYAATLGTFVNPALGAGEDGPGSSVFWGFDDVYADFTPARVEIADTNTWAARTKSEIQIPKTWSDGSVTCQANAGAFTSGQTVYVYVITDSNTVVGPERTMVVA